MSTNFNILVEHKSVVAVAAQVIKGSEEAEAVRRNSEEEKKNSIEGIQLQEIDASKVASSSAPHKFKEEKVPLI